MGETPPSPETRAGGPPPSCVCLPFPPGHTARRPRWAASGRAARPSTHSPRRVCPSSWNFLSHFLSLGPSVQRGLGCRGWGSHSRASSICHQTKPKSAKAVPGVCWRGSGGRLPRHPNRATLPPGRAGPGETAPHTAPRQCQPREPPAPPRRGRATPGKSERDRGSCYVSFFFLFFRDTIFFFEIFFVSILYFSDITRIAVSCLPHTQHTHEHPRTRTHSH